MDEIARGWTAPSLAAGPPDQTVIGDLHTAAICASHLPTAKCTGKQCTGKRCAQAELHQLVGQQQHRAGQLSIFIA